MYVEKHTDALIKDYPFTVTALHVQHCDVTDSPFVEEHALKEPLDLKEAVLAVLDDEEKIQHEYLDYYFEFPEKWLPKLDKIETQFREMGLEKMRLFIEQDYECTEACENLHNIYPEARDFINNMYYFNHV